MSHSQPKSLPPDLPRLPPRGRDTSKRDYGRAVIVGGAAGMAGAPALAAMAALRSGAGLVEALVPASVVGITAAFDPCVMTHGLAADGEGLFDASAGQRIRERLASADAVAIGPGLGRSATVTQLVHVLWRDLPQPAVFDADALFAIARLSPRDLAAHAGPRIITPHAGEMLRLLQTDPSSPRARDRDWLEAQAADLASALDAVAVLKGPATLIVDRARRATNDTGNPGMATGGTGDVLTGIIAALLAQGLGSFDAARLGAWVHGRAGDLAAADLGEVSMTARDVLDRLAPAFMSLLRFEKRD